MIGEITHKTEDGLFKVNEILESDITIGNIRLDERYTIRPRMSGEDIVSFDIVGSLGEEM